MTSIVIDVSISVDGFIAGPADGPADPLGKRGGMHLFDWYFGGASSYNDTMFRPAGENVKVVEEMYETFGAMLTGRRTYEIANGWNGTHPVNDIPVVVMTHNPPSNPPAGKSPLIFVTDGIESAVTKARAVASGKNVGVAGSSAARQALRAGLVDEIYLHIVPILLGDGVRLFEQIADEAISLSKIGVVDALEATHVRYKVIRP